MASEKTSKPSDLRAPRLIKVRLVRVEDKPQRYAAHSMNDNTLLGYCGRDGRITHPVGDVAVGTQTSIALIDDPRISRKGLVRSLETVRKLTGPSDPTTPDAPKQKDPKWIEIARKKLGLYASGPVRGPGWSNRGYVCLLYEVTEKLQGSTPTEIRVRTVTGRACRLHGEGYDAFVSLFLAYAQHAEQHEKDEHVERHLECYHKDEITKRKGVSDDLSPAYVQKLDAAEALRTKKKTKKKGKSV